MGSGRRGSLIFVGRQRFLVATVGFVGAELRRLGCSCGLINGGISPGGACLILEACTFLRTPVSWLWIINVTGPMRSIIL